MKMFSTLVAVLLSTSFASAEFKLAYVDVQKAIEKSVAGKKAKEEMKKEAEKKNKDLEKIITNRIAIPRFGDLQKTESLNVATATAIFLSEFKRGES